MSYEAFRLMVQGWASSGYLPEALAYGFVVNALLAGLLIGPVLGGLGTLVVVKVQITPMAKARCSTFKRSKIPLDTAAE